MGPERTTRLQDNGQRTIEKTGCLLEPKEGHGRFDIIPAEPLFRLARSYEQGATKYAPNNWKKGMAWSKNLSSLERHLQKWKRGDSDEDHMAMVLWRVMAMMYYEEHHIELCDLPERRTNNETHTEYNPGEIRHSTTKRGRGYEYTITWRPKDRAQHGRKTRSKSRKRRGRKILRGLTKNWTMQDPTNTR